MVRPANFGFNPETAASNAFQKNEEGHSRLDIIEKSKEEFDQFVLKLRSYGVDVQVIDDTELPIKTDAVFPNNWITTHRDGKIITYPMLSDNRRLERREDIVEALTLKYQFQDRIALEKYEAENKILEGTGSLILDRINKLAYACFSPRTNSQVLGAFCEQMGYEPVLFRSVDGLGQPIYHTNVMMALGENFVVICLATIKDKKEKQFLLDRFKASGKQIIEITLIQMMAFAGNMLQVKSKTTGKPYLVMSQQAYESLTKAQIDSIQSHTDILYSPLDTIETYGGGSARCMMAEIFVPENIEHS